MTGYFIMSCAKFDPLAKVTVARFLHYKGTVFSSAVGRESVGYFAPCKYPVPLQPCAQCFQHPDPEISHYSRSYKIEVFWHSVDIY